MNNLKREQLIEQKEGLETLYNKYLLEVLPLATTKEEKQNVELTMTSIDETLSKIEKELTIEIDTTTGEAVEETAPEKEVLYNSLYYITKYIYGSTIEYYVEGVHGYDVKVAQYNVLENKGYIITPDGEYKQVKAYKTLCNKLFKIDNNLSMDSESTIKQMRKQLQKELKGIAS